MLSERVTYSIACAPSVQIPRENRPIKTVLAPNAINNPVTVLELYPKTIVSVGMNLAIKNWSDTFTRL